MTTLQPHTAVLLSFALCLAAPALGAAARDGALRDGFARGYALGGLVRKVDDQTLYRIDGKAEIRLDGRWFADLHLDFASQAHCKARLIVHANTHRLKLPRKRCFTIVGGVRAEPLVEWRDRLGLRKARIKR